MTEWNEQHLKELTQKMESENSREVSLDAGALLSRIMSLDAATWSALGYAETDRVSLVRHLGSLGCRVDWILSSAVIDQRPLDLELARLLIKMGAFNNRALSYAVENQQPLSFELAKLLIDAGAFDKDALRMAAQYQHPLTPELAKLLIDAGAFNKDALSIAASFQIPLSLDLAKLLVDAGAFREDALSAAAEFQRPLIFELADLFVGCNPAAQDDDGWDALVWLAHSGHPADPQVTDLFLSRGCRTDLEGCRTIDDEHCARFDRILKEHSEWKKERARLAVETSQADVLYGPDWGR